MARHHGSARPGRPIRVGVVGVGRGQSFVASAEPVGMKLVALCDTWEERLKEVARRWGAAAYTDFDRFLEHDMDAVVLANYFHEHAPMAIRALEAGKHVMSETTAAKTLAECAALVRAVERTGRVYMLAENYPYTAFNQEMRRLYRAGEIGRATYAEGEYNHPMAPDDRLRLAPGRNHWRNWTPPTYYSSHALAPLMYITDAMPLSVNALSIPCPEMERRTVRMGDAGCVILCRMTGGAVFRIFGLVLPGHSNWYRLHGAGGAMEITRGPGYFGPGQVRVWHEPWNRRPDQPLERVYTPDWPEHGELARRASHGGGDFWTTFHFANAIRAGRQPYLDVHRATAMAAVGILAWRSCLADGAPFRVPDFRREAQCRAVEDDHWSPFPEDAGPGQPPPSIRGRRTPSPAALRHAREVWRSIGYPPKAKPPRRAGRRSKR